MTFRIGQKVVCVDAACEEEFTLDGLQKGVIYEIAGVCAWCWRRKNNTGVHLREIERDGVPYWRGRFRPLVSNSTRESRQAIIDNLIKQPELV